MFGNRPKENQEKNGFVRTKECPSCDPCGVCNDCQEKPLLALGQPTFAQRNNMPQIFAFEPVKSTFNALKKVISDLQLNDIVTVEQKAFADRTYEGNFVDSETPGNELGAITTNTKYAKVLITSVDEYYEQNFKSRKIDVLEIDTEGFDPLVLKGATKVLQSNLVRLLIFEYHGMAEWQKKDLKDVVDSLDQVGYDCYFMMNTKRSLLRLTGCWVSAFEFHSWSNVACVWRGDIAWSTILQSVAFPSE